MLTLATLGKPIGHHLHADAVIPLNLRLNCALLSVFLLLDLLTCLILNDHLIGRENSCQKHPQTTQWNVFTRFFDFCLFPVDFVYFFIFLFIASSHICTFSLYLTNKLFLCQFLYFFICLLTLTLIFVSVVLHLFTPLSLPFLEEMN